MHMITTSYTFCWRKRPLDASVCAQLRLRPRAAQSCDPFAHDVATAARYGNSTQMCESDS